VRDYSLTANSTDERIKELTNLVQHGGNKSPMPNQRNAYAVIIFNISASLRDATRTLNVKVERSRKLSGVETFIFNSALRYSVPQATEVQAKN
jgi:hypothetical protein